MRRIGIILLEGIRYLAGDDTRVVVGNDVENEDVNIDEYEAIEEIQDKIRSQSTRVLL